MPGEALENTIGNSRDTVSGNAHPLLVVNRDPVSDMRIQFQDIRDAIEDLGERLDSVREAGRTEAASGLVEELESLRNNVQQLQVTSEAITAPVRMPAPEDMTVKLVNSTSLERFGGVQK